MAWFTQNLPFIFCCFHICPIEGQDLPLLCAYSLKDNTSELRAPTANRSTAPGVSLEVPSGATARDLNRSERLGPADVR